MFTRHSDLCRISRAVSLGRSRRDGASVISSEWPGESSRTRGRPLTSVNADFRCFGRRANGRQLARRPPFSTRCRGVCFDVRAVDRDRPDSAGRACQSLKYFRLDALPAPAVEAVVDRGVRPYSGGQCRHRRSRAQHVHDAADHAMIVNPCAPRWPRGSKGSSRFHSASLSQ